MPPPPWGVSPARYATPMAASAGARPRRKSASAAIFACRPDNPATRADTLTRSASSVMRDGGPARIAPPAYRQAIDGTAARRAASDLQRLVVPQRQAAHRPAGCGMDRVEHG